MSIEEIIDRFSVLNTGNGGIESFVVRDAPSIVLERISKLTSEAISKVQLNQLLGFTKEKAVSDGFFRYYWTESPVTPYKLSEIPGYSSEYKTHEKIRDINHLLYGLYRIFVDGLLYRGNVRLYYREFSAQSYEAIDSFVRTQVIDTIAVKRRGPTLPLKAISKDSRYLISETACKSYGDTPKSTSDMRSALLSAWRAHEQQGGGAITVKALFSKHLSGTKHAAQQGQLELAADDILNDQVSSIAEIESKYERIAGAFIEARTAALENTALYLSLVNDLDVYVATSMRLRSDFRGMADNCETIFTDPRILDLHLRYFDPTMSAAEGHQDKGLIECLMVKCAKALVYCAGQKESYGKDAEAAMALSLGKPVIFLCDEEQRRQFYRELHPLSRLINFQTGVAVGAMVTSKTSDVPELLDRLFENEMEYYLRQPTGKCGYLQLVEKLTDSVVRLQTNDRMLSEAFWNYYRSQS